MEISKNSGDQQGDCQVESACCALKDWLLTKVGYIDWTAATDTGRTAS